MFRSSHFLARALALMALATVLAGCLSKPTPPTRFYVLGTPPAEVAALAGAERQRPLSVMLDTLRMPQYLERPQIVTRADANRLVLAEFEQWGGNFGKDLRRVLAARLGRLLATPEVYLDARRAPSPPDVAVEVEILHFERWADRRVRLAARWRLRVGGERGAAEMTELASAPLDPAAGMGATVAAMSDLAGQLAVAIARAALAAGGR